LRQALTQNVTSGPLSLIGPRHVGAILALSAVVGLGGLGIVFGTLVALAISIGPHLGGGIFPLLFLLGGIGVAGVCIIVTSLLRMLRTPAGMKSKLQIPIVPSALEPPPHARVLPEFRDPVSSVVEHTTSRLATYAPPEPEGPNRN
jgi:hypothetical protein